MLHPRQQPVNLSSRASDRAKLQRERLARLGVALLANPPEQKQAAFTSVAEDPKEPGFLRRILQGSLPFQVGRSLKEDVLPALETYQRNVQAPFGALVSNTSITTAGLATGNTSLALMGIKGGLEHDKQVVNNLQSLVAGKQGFRETGFKLGELQRKRPGGTQFLTESISPLGLAESVIPVGRIAKLAKIAAEAPMRIGGRAAPRLSTPSEVVGRVQAPGALRTLLEKARENTASEWALSKFSDTAVANPNSIVHTGVMVGNVLDQQVDDAVGVLMRETNIAGDVRSVFGFDDFGVVQDPLSRSRLARMIRPRSLATAKEGQESILGRSFQEIAQFPYKFALTSVQRQIMDNLNQMIIRNERYLATIGADADALIKSNVPGRFFPDFWEYLDGMALEQKGVSRALGVNPFFGNSRLHMEASEAVERGYSGDPLRALEILFRSQYKRGRDKIVADIVKGHGYTQLERMKFFDTALLDDAANTARVNAGAISAHRIVFDFTAGDAPKIGEFGRMRTTPGAVAARANYPILMEDLERAVLSADNVHFRAARQSLREQATAMRNEAAAAFKDSKSRVADLRVKTRFRPDLGEVQFPGTSVSGRIFSAEERLKQVFHSFPEADLTDLNTIPLAQMEDLKRVITNQSPAGALYQAVSVGAEISGASRTMIAALDLGVGAIHLAPLMASNPVAWSKVMKLSMKALWEPQKMATFLDDHWETVQKLHNQNQLHGAGSEFVESLRQGGLLNRVLTSAEQIPKVGIAPKVAGQTLRLVEEQFNSALLGAKVYFYEALEPMARASGSANWEAELAEVTAKLTGTISMANLGINPTTTQTLGALFLFAPRYTLAAAGLMLDAARPGLKGDMARKVFGDMMVAGSLMYSALALRLGQEPKLDPTKGDFLTLQVGDARVGIGSKYVQLARYAAGFLQQSYEDPQAFTKFDSRDNVLVRAVRANASPLGSVGWNMVNGRNYIGEPVNGINFFKQQLPDSVLPFWLSGQFDTPSPGWNGIPAEFFGLRTFPVSLYERGQQLADVEAHKLGDTDFRDLTKLKQQEILRDNPEVAALFDEGNKIWGERGNEINQYREEIRQFRDEQFEPELQKAIARFERTGDGRTFRETYSELGTWRRKTYEAFNEKYVDAIKEINEQARNPDAHMEDIAYEDYITTVVLGNFENEEGEYQFKRRREAELGMQQKYGETIWQYIQERRSVHLAPVVQEYLANRDFLESYWKIGELMLNSLDREALVPEWDRYRESRLYARKLKDEQFPIFKEVTSATTKARQIYRERNPDIEAFLFRFGYIETLRSPENQRQDVGKILGTPVLLGQ